MKFFQNHAPARPLAVVGTGSAKTLEILYQHGFRVREAWSTRGMLEALGERPALVILDEESLGATPGLSPEVLEGALESARQDGLGVVSSSQFLAESQQIICAPQDGRKTSVRARFLPARVAIISNYAGGTGKTTLALGAARHFRAESGLPCALLELGLGGSAFQARLGGKFPSLYSRVTQSSSPGQWEGVDLYPLDGREAQVLSSDPRLPETLAQITQAHTLTILDAHPGSPLWPLALSLSTDIFVVASPRADALAQTESLLGEIREASAAMEIPPKPHLVLNMVGSWGERLGLGSQAAVHLPYDVNKAGSYAASLAAPLLTLLYPGWKVSRKGALA